MDILTLVAPPDEGTRPIEFISLTWGTTTNELGGYDFTGRGAPGGLQDAAASPALIANTGGVAQDYISLFYGHKATTIDPMLIPDAQRLRGTLQFFNRTDIGAGTIGSDPLVVELWEINTDELPEGFDFPE